MSWLDACTPWRRLGAPAVIIATSLGLSGCLTPLYGSLNGRLVGELQAVAVDPIPDRLGHYLQDQLITDLNGTGSHPVPKYRLSVATRERVQTALVDVVTRRASAATVVIEADYVLTPVGGDAPVTKGTVTMAATYNRSEQRFANIRAAQDAEIRDARTLADQISIRVSSALAER